MTAETVLEFAIQSQRKSMIKIKPAIVNPTFMPTAIEPPVNFAGPAVKVIEVLFSTERPEVTSGVCNTDTDGTVTVTTAGPPLSPQTSQDFVTVAMGIVGSATISLQPHSSTVNVVEIVRKPFTHSSQTST